MFKISVFNKRNPKLTHDEYRSCHVGFHLSGLRRLRDIRGCVSNIWSDRDFDEQVPGAGKHEPVGFFDLWDSLDEMWFDSYELYQKSYEWEPDKATDHGLVFDVRGMSAMKNHMKFLFSEAPKQFVCAEHIILPVVRKEHIPIKVQQWGKRSKNLSKVEFMRIWEKEYAPLFKTVNNINGYIITFPIEPIDSMNDLYSTEFTNDSINENQSSRSINFLSKWDGFAFLWIESLEDLRKHRRPNHDQ